MYDPADLTARTLVTSVISALNMAQNTGGGVTSGHLVQFSGTGGRLITTAGAALSAYLPLAGGMMSGALAMAWKNTSKWASRTLFNNRACVYARICDEL